MSNAIADAAFKRLRVMHLTRLVYSAHEGYKRDPRLRRELRERVNGARPARGVLATYRSAKSHQLHPVQGFALRVTLLASDNVVIKYPVEGVLHVLEQGFNLGASHAVFHHLHDDGTLGPPVAARNPKFSYGGDHA